MGVAAHEVGVERVLRQAAGRLVEGDRRQRAGLDRAHEVVAVLEMLGPIGGAGRETSEIIEGLMVRLEIRALVVAYINDLALLAWRPAAVFEREPIGTRVPGPTHALGS